MGALVSAVRGDPVDQDTIDYSGERVVRPDEKSPIRDYLTHEALVYFTPGKERKARDQFPSDARKKIIETTEKTTETVIDDGKMNVLETKEVKKTVVITTEQLEEQPPKHKIIQGEAESEKAHETSPTIVLPTPSEKVTRQEYPVVEKEKESSAKDEEREGPTRKIAPTDDKKGEFRAGTKEEPVKVIAPEELRKREKAEAPLTTPPVSLLPKEYRIKKVPAPTDEGVTTARVKGAAKEEAPALVEEKVGIPRLKEPPIEIISPKKAKPEKKAETPVRTPSRSPERHHFVEGGTAHEKLPVVSSAAKETMKKRPPLDEGVTTAREKAVDDRSKDEKAPSHEAKEIDTKLYKEHPVELIEPEKHEPQKQAETPLRTPTRSPVEGDGTGITHREPTVSSAPAPAIEHVKAKDVEKTQERSLESAPEQPESTSTQVPSRLTAMESISRSRTGLGEGESAPMSSGSHQKLGGIAQEFQGGEVRSVPDRKVKLTEKRKSTEKMMRSGSHERMLKSIPKPTTEGSTMKPPSATKKEGSIMRSPSAPKREGSIMKPPSAPKREGSIMRSPSAPKREGSIMKPPAAPEREGSIMRSPAAPKRESSIMKPPSAPKREGSIMRSPSAPKREGSIMKPPAAPEREGSIMRSPAAPKRESSIMKPPSAPKREGSIMRSPSAPKRESSIMKPPSAPKREGSIMRSPSAPKREGSIMKPPNDRKNEGPFMELPNKSMSGGLVAKPSPKSRSKGSLAKRHTKSKSDESITKPFNATRKEGSITGASTEPKVQNSHIKTLPENKEGPLTNSTSTQQKQESSLTKPASQSGEEGQRAAAGRLMTPPTESATECLEATTEPQREGGVFTSTVVEKKSTTMKSVEEGSPTLHTAQANEDHPFKSPLEQKQKQATECLEAITEPQRKGEVFTSTVVEKKSTTMKSVEEGSPTLHTAQANEDHPFKTPLEQKQQQATERLGATTEPQRKGEVFTSTVVEKKSTTMKSVEEGSPTLHTAQANEDHPFKTPLEQKQQQATECLGATTEPQRKGEVFTSTVVEKKSTTMKSVEEGSPTLHTAQANENHPFKTPFEQKQKQATECLEATTEPQRKGEVFTSTVVEKKSTTMKSVEEGSPTLHTAQANEDHPFKTPLEQKQKQATKCLEATTEAQRKGEVFTSTVVEKKSTTMKTVEEGSPTLHTAQANEDHPFKTPLEQKQQQATKCLEATTEAQRKGEVFTSTVVEKKSTTMKTVEEGSPTLHTAQANEDHPFKTPLEQKQQQATECLGATTEPQRKGEVFTSTVVEKKSTTMKSVEEGSPTLHTAQANEDHPFKTPLEQKQKQATKCLEATTEAQRKGAVFTSTVVEKKSTTMKTVEEGSPTLHTAQANEDHPSKTPLEQKTKNTAMETSVQQEKHSIITKSPTQSTHVMVDVERVKEKKRTVTTSTDVITAREPDAKFVYHIILEKPMFV